MMTLEKFEEASELVKKVTNPTKLIYSEYLSAQTGAKVYLKPENMQHTLRIFVSYLGRHKFMLLIVSILVTVSALANLLGTYMIRPVVNNLANGDLHSLAIGVLVAAGIFAIGALAAWGYSQTMVKAAQQVVFDIRRDLFAHMQTLPLRFFDQKRHGDIMLSLIHI